MGMCAIGFLLEIVSIERVPVAGHYQLNRFRDGFCWVAALNLGINEQGMHFFVESHLLADKVNDFTRKLVHRDIRAVGGNRLAMDHSAAYFGGACA